MDKTDMLKVLEKQIRELEVMQDAIPIDCEIRYLELKLKIADVISGLMQVVVSVKTRHTKN